MLRIVIPSQTPAPPAHSQTPAPLYCRRHPQGNPQRSVLLLAAPDECARIATRLTCCRTSRPAATGSGGGHVPRLSGRTAAAVAAAGLIRAGVETVAGGGWRAGRLMPALDAKGVKPPLHTSRPDSASHPNAVSHAQLNSALAKSAIPSQPSQWRCRPSSPCRAACARAAPRLLPRAVPPRASRPARGPRRRAGGCSRRATPACPRGRVRCADSSVAI